MMLSRTRLKRELRARFGVDFTDSYLEVMEHLWGCLERQRITRQRFINLTSEQQTNNSRCINLSITSFEILSDAMHDDRDRLELAMQKLESCLLGVKPVS